jgi:hypothetical protein
MRRIATAITLAVLALVLSASITMAAPRISPKAGSFDVGVTLNWLSVGGSADYNMPLSDKMSLLVGVDAGFTYTGWLDVYATGAVIFPIWKYDQFKLAVMAGPQVGYRSDYFYVGAMVGLTAEYKLNDQWSFYAESAYGPGFGFYAGGAGYYGNGRYGVYATYKMNKDMTLYFGERSIMWYPGFIVGLSF